MIQRPFFALALALPLTPALTPAPARPLVAGLKRAAALVAVAALTSCGGGGGGGGEASGAGPSASNAWIGDPAAAEAAQVTVLMMGNSHTSGNDLPGQLDSMLRAGLAGSTVATAVAPRWMFLDERSADGASMDLLRGRRWTAVVLQAQKYSSSGQFTYSTSGAESLVRTARSVGALPVMFPEWPRRGVSETARIYDLHVSIATAEPACVAPIGQAWDLALQRFPALQLHAGDGNHATTTGAYLAALMLYATLSGRSPLTLPDLANGVDTAVQAQLRQVAADTVQAIPPRQHCPADPPLARAAGPG